MTQLKWMRNAAAAFVMAGLLSGAAFAQNASGGRGGDNRFGDGNSFSGGAWWAPNVAAGPGGAGGNATKITDALNDCGAGSGLGILGSVFGLSFMQGNRMYGRRRL